MFEDGIFCVSIWFSCSDDSHLEFFHLTPNDVSTQKPATTKIRIHIFFCCCCRDSKEPSTSSRTFPIPDVGSDFPDVESAPVWRRSRFPGRTARSRVEPFLAPNLLCSKFWNSGFPSVFLLLFTILSRIIQYYILKSYLVVFFCFIVCTLSSWLCI